MLAAIEALQAFDRDLPLRDLTLQQKARRSELLANAAELVFFFVIQREAMKLPLHDELFDDHGIPEEVGNRTKGIEMKSKTTKRVNESVNDAIDRPLVRRISFLRRRTLNSVVAAATRDSW